MRRSTCGPRLAEETPTLRGHTKYVASLACSRDGERLVSGSDDRTLKVWDLVNMRELLSVDAARGGGKRRCDLRSF